MNMKMLKLIWNSLNVAENKTLSCLYHNINENRIRKHDKSIGINESNTLKK